MIISKKILRDLQKYLVGTEEFSFNADPSDNLYPISLAFTLDDSGFYYEPVDKHGIPFKIYQSVGKQYNPTRVAAYALANYNRFIEQGCEGSRDTFIKCANWFLGFDDAKYQYHFDWDDLRAPWISCMAQGEAASVLVRAYRVTADSTYLVHAEKSLNPFFLPISEGGVQSRLDDGSVFLEEYPSNRATHVLNGFLYAMIGLHEFCGSCESEKHKALFMQLIESVSNNIGKWSSGTWSLYEDPSVKGAENFCTPSYHNLHISQLKWVCARMESPELRKVISSWESGKDSLPVRIRALWGKVLFRLSNQAQR